MSITRLRMARTAVALASAVALLVGGAGPAAAVAAAPPALTAGTPVILGIPRVGETLTVDPGSWGPDGVTLIYRWYVNGVAVRNSDDVEFTVPASALGLRISVRVAGKLAGYTPAAKNSARTAKVGRGVLESSAPVIRDASTFLEQKLVADPGAWGPGSVRLAYQWLRDGVPITGATTPWYYVGLADRGHQVGVRVTGSKSGYATLSRDSAGTVSIPATTLTVSPTVVDTMIDNGITYSLYQGRFVRVAGGQQFVLSAPAGFFAADAELWWATQHPKTGAVTYVAPLATTVSEDGSQVRFSVPVGSTLRTMKTSAATSYVLLDLEWSTGPDTAGVLDLYLRF